MKSPRTTKSSPDKAPSEQPQPELSPQEKLAQADADHGEAIAAPAEWLSLFGRLWASDEQSIGDFLPEIVALIRTTKPSIAAKCLFTVMLSPKVQNGSRHVKLLTPSVVEPGYLTNNLFADAAGLPVGEVRKKAAGRLNQAGTEVGHAKALTMEDAVEIFEEFAKKAQGEEKDEASAKRASRARKLLGMQRKPGRPKTGQE